MGFPYIVARAKSGLFRWGCVVGLLLGCSETNSTDLNSDGLCEPFTTRVCLCVPGPDQVQVCEGDGRGYGPCVCTGADSDTESGAGTNSDAAGSDASEGSQCSGGCDDNNPCTEDLCTDGSCVHVDLVQPCDDGDPCTMEDICADGVCTGQADPTCIYAQNPDLASCVEGVLSQAQKDLALEAVNNIRGLHGLKGVAYYPEGDVYAQRAALMMAANDDLSHQPPEDWACWSQEGSQGAASSNLHIEWSTNPILSVDPANVVVGFLIDLNVESLGHRRWVLDPFLKKVAFGGVHGSGAAGSAFPFIYTAALQVIHEDHADISASATPSGVAYPVGEYPSAYFDKTWYLSFSALVNASSSWENEFVDVSSARVTMTDPAGVSLVIQELSANNNYFGLPNIVQWKALGLEDSVQYQVVIDGITHEGKPLEYGYVFRLIP